MLFVYRGLAMIPGRKDSLAISYMPMYDIPNLQPPRMPYPHIPTFDRFQRVLHAYYARSIWLFEDISTRMCRDTVNDAVPHELDVVGCDALGV